MTESRVSRASARRGEVRPSNFGRVAAAIDDAEGKAWARIGGPNRGDFDAIHVLEGRLCRVRPSTEADGAWLARRLERAVENGWSEEATAPLVRLAASAVPGNFRKSENSDDVAIIAT